jgi:hypothetical protein
MSVLKPSGFHPRETRSPVFVWWFNRLQAPSMVKVLDPYGRIAQRLP